jgi:hypothetical protein
MAEKVCSVCEILKPEDKFYKHRDGKLRDKCKRCHVILTSERAKSRGQEYLTKEANKAIERKFGLTRKAYSDMLLTQEGKCPICWTDQRNEEHIFPVDHDHNTGRVRGLLCNLCNIGLGSFRDDPVVLQNAIDYLNKHKQEA